MKVPCEECPILVMCKNKAKVDCPILFNWGHSHEYMFAAAERILPNLMEVRSGKIVVSKFNPHYSSESKVVWMKV